MEIAKFIFRLKNKMLRILFDNYFTNLCEIHKYNTRQKGKSEYYHHSSKNEFGKKRLNNESLKVWESISLAKKECSSSKFKKMFKDDILNYYFENLLWEF